ncbi:MAG: hypothetical protein ACI936_002138 [Paraglaciecola sp.]|jgi:hypothetical protein
MVAFLFLTIMFKLLTVKVIHQFKNKNHNYIVNFRDLNLDYVRSLT